MEDKSDRVVDRMESPRGEASARDNVRISSKHKKASQADADPFHKAPTSRDMLPPKETRRSRTARRKSIQAVPLPADTTDSDATHESVSSWRPSLGVHSYKWEQQRGRDPAFESTGRQGRSREREYERSESASRRARSAARLSLSAAKLHQGTDSEDSVKPVQCPSKVRSVRRRSMLSDRDCSVASERPGQDEEPRKKELREEQPRKERKGEKRAKEKGEASSRDALKMESLGASDSSVKTKQPPKKQDVSSNSFSFMKEEASETEEVSFHGPASKALNVQRPSAVKPLGFGHLDRKKSDSAEAQVRQLPDASSGETAWPKKSAERKADCAVTTTRRAAKAEAATRAGGECEKRPPFKKVEFNSRDHVHSAVADGVVEPQKKFKKKKKDHGQKENRGVAGEDSAAPEKKSRSVSPFKMTFFKQSAKEGGGVASEERARSKSPFNFLKFGRSSKTERPRSKSPLKEEERARSKSPFSMRWFRKDGEITVQESRARSKSPFFGRKKEKESKGPEPKPTPVSAERGQIKPSLPALEGPKPEATKEQKRGRSRSPFRMPTFGKKEKTPPIMEDQNHVAAVQLLFVKGHLPGGDLAILNPGAKIRTKSTSPFKKATKEQKKGRSRSPFSAKKRPSDEQCRPTRERSEWTEGLLQQSDEEADVTSAPKAATCQALVAVEQPKCKVIETLTMEEFALKESGKSKVTEALTLEEFASREDKKCPGRDSQANDSQPSRHEETVIEPLPIVVPRISAGEDARRAATKSPFRRSRSPQHRVSPSRQPSEGAADVRAPVLLSETAQKEVAKRLAAVTGASKGLGFWENRVQDFNRRRSQKLPRGKSTAPEAGSCDGPEAPLAQDMPDFPADEPLPSLPQGPSNSPTSKAKADPSDGGDSNGQLGDAQGSFDSPPSTADLAASVDTHKVQVAVPDSPPESFITIEMGSSLEIERAESRLVKEETKPGSDAKSVVDSIKRPQEAPEKDGVLGDVEAEEPLRKSPKRELFEQTCKEKDHERESVRATTASPVSLLRSPERTAAVVRYTDPRSAFEELMGGKANGGATVETEDTAGRSPRKRGVLSGVASWLRKKSPTKMRAEAIPEGKDGLAWDGGFDHFLVAREEVAAPGVKRQEVAGRVSYSDLVCISKTLPKPLQSDAAAPVRHQNEATKSIQELVAAFYSLGTSADDKSSVPASDAGNLSVLASEGKGVEVLEQIIEGNEGGREEAQADLERPKTAESDVVAALETPKSSEVPDEVTESEDVADSIASHVPSQGKNEDQDPNPSCEALPAEVADELSCPLEAAQSPEIGRPERASRSPEPLSCEDDDEVILGEDDALTETSSALFGTARSPEEQSEEQDAEKTSEKAASTPAILERSSSLEQQTIAEGTLPLTMAHRPGESDDEGALKEEQLPSFVTAVSSEQDEALALAVANSAEQETKEGALLLPTIMTVVSPEKQIAAEKGGQSPEKEDLSEDGLPSPLTAVSLVKQVETVTPQISGKQGALSEGALALPVTAVSLEQQIRTEESARSSQKEEALASSSTAVGPEMQFPAKETSSAQSPEKEEALSEDASPSPVTAHSPEEKTPDRSMRPRLSWSKTSPTESAEDPLKLWRAMAYPDGHASVNFEEALESRRHLGLAAADVALLERASLKTLEGLDALPEEESPADVTADAGDREASVLVQPDGPVVWAPTEVEKEQVQVILAQKWDEFIKDFDEPSEAPAFRASPSRPPLAPRTLRVPSGAGVEETPPLVLDLAEFSKASPLKEATDESPGDSQSAEEGVEQGCGRVTNKADGRSDAARGGKDAGQSPKSKRGFFSAWWKGSKSSPATKAQETGSAKGSRPGQEENQGVMDVVWTDAEKQEDGVNALKERCGDQKGVRLQLEVEESCPEKIAEIDAAEETCAEVGTEGEAFAEAEGVPDTKRSSLLAADAIADEREAKACTVNAKMEMYSDCQINNRDEIDEVNGGTVSVGREGAPVTDRVSDVTEKSNETPSLTQETSGDGTKTEQLKDDEKLVTVETAPALMMGVSLAETDGDVADADVEHCPQEGSREIAKKPKMLQQESHTGDEVRSADGLTLNRNFLTPRRELQKGSMTDEEAQWGTTILDVWPKDDMPSERRPSLEPLDANRATKEGAVTGNGRPFYAEDGFLDENFSDRGLEMSEPIKTGQDVVGESMVLTARPPTRRSPSRGNREYARSASLPNEVRVNEAGFASPKSAALQLEELAELRAHRERLEAEKGAIEKRWKASRKELKDVRRYKDGLEKEVDLMTRLLKATEEAAKKTVPVSDASVGTDAAKLADAACDPLRRPTLDKTTSTPTVIMVEKGVSPEPGPVFCEVAVGTEHVAFSESAVGSEQGLFMKDASVGTEKIALFDKRVGSDSKDNQEGPVIDTRKGFCPAPADSVTSTTPTREKSVGTEGLSETGILEHKVHLLRSQIRDARQQRDALQKELERAADEKAKLASRLADSEKVKPPRDAPYEMHELHRSLAKWQARAQKAEQELTRVKQPDTLPSSPLKQNRSPITRAILSTGSPGKKGSSPSSHEGSPREKLRGIPEELDTWQDRALAAEKQAAERKLELWKVVGELESAREELKRRGEEANRAETEASDAKAKVRRMHDDAAQMREEISILRSTLEMQSLKPGEAAALREALAKEREQHRREKLEWRETSNRLKTLLAFWPEEVSDGQGLASEAKDGSVQGSNGANQDGFASPIHVAAARSLDKVASDVRESSESSSRDFEGFSPGPVESPEQFEMHSNPLFPKTALQSPKPEMADLTQNEEPEQKVESEEGNLQETEKAEGPKAVGKVGASSLLARRSGNPNQALSVLVTEDEEKAPGQLSPAESVSPVPGGKAQLFADGGLSSPVNVHPLTRTGSWRSPTDSNGSRYGSPQQSPTSTKYDSPGSSPGSDWSTCRDSNDMWRVKSGPLTKAMSLSPKEPRSVSPGAFARTMDELVVPKKLSPGKGTKDLPRWGSRESPEWTNALQRRDKLAGVEAEAHG